MWLESVTRYTLAGSVSAVAVGYGLGWLGRPLPGPNAVVTAVVIGVVAVLATVRELDWVRLPLPQPRRQTRDAWAKRWGVRRASLWWGFDIGATVNTRFTFAGVWVVLLLPVLAADPALGAMALLAAWIGRAAPVWLLPRMVPDGLPALDMLDAIAARDRLFRYTHVLGVALVTAYAVGL